MTRITLQIVTSNWTYECESINGSARDVSNLLALQATIIADMDASDTALVRVSAKNGTLVADAGGNATLSISGFQGILVS